MPIVVSFEEKIITKKSGGMLSCASASKYVNPTKNPKDYEVIATITVTGVLAKKLQLVGKKRCAQEMRKVCTINPKVHRKINAVKKLIENSTISDEKVDNAITALFNDLSTDFDYQGKEGEELLRLSELMYRLRPKVMQKIQQQVAEQHKGCCDK